MVIVKANILYKERVPIDHSEITYYTYYICYSVISIKDSANLLNSVMQDLVHPNQ